MKILIYTDVHWCKFSSVIREIDDKYSVRLQHLINSVNWAERLAEEHNCNMIISGGDFFDSHVVSDFEISSLSEIKWAKIPHKFILGNHEIQNKNKELSSAHIFKLMGFELITEPEKEDIGNVELCYLPYMFEYPSLNELFGDCTKKRVVFSHNDIEGIALGGYVFEKGFSLADISKNCDLFLNGHIHAKGTYGNMLNLGNLCGQNFGENNVPHNAYILDTDTLELTAFENMYAFNFYKIDCTTKVKFPKLKNNPCLWIRCSENTLEEVKNKVNEISDLVYIRYQLESKEVEQEEQEEVELEQIDHLEALRTYILENVGSTEIIKEELANLTA